MKLVALVKTPANPQAAVEALAQASGMTLAEARMRAAPEPPALLARLAPDAADALVAKLRAAGLAALALSEPVPSDAQRTLVRSWELGPTSLTFTPRAGEPVQVESGEILAILRAASSVRAQSESREKSRSLDVAGAVVTGGLKLTKTTERTVRSSSEETEQAIFVYARDGRCAVLRELQLEFTCLGKLMGPSRTANMAALAKLLRENAPGAFYDERLVRLGRRPLPFVVGGEAHVHTASVTSSRMDTASGLDVLAEVMHQALRAKLLP